jgi:predicted DNA-binding transcriptional regulator AlpA
MLQTIAETRAKRRQLPPELIEESIVGTDTAALFCGYSTDHWRELVAKREAPSPIKFSARRFGWRVRDLKAWIKAKEDASRKDA